MSWRTGSENMSGFRLFQCPHCGRGLSLIGTLREYCPPSCNHIGTILSGDEQTRMVYIGREVAKK